MEVRAVMQFTWEEIQINAVKFSKKWKDAYNEEAQAQAFLLDFFMVFGVEALEVGAFEYRVPKEIEGKGYIDYFWKKKIAIEMKSKGKSLDKAYEQLKNYIIQLPADEIPELLMVCDFETVVLYHRGKNIRKQFKVKDLSKNIRQFASIAGYETTREIEDQIEVNVRAAEKMAKLHDALKYHGYEGHDLEVYLVRLLFCLFADDTGIFPKQSFMDYLENSKEDGSDLSDRITRLFEVLNMSDEMRKKRTLLTAELKQFRYINGGLFSILLPMAEFNKNMRQTLIDCCHFDWNKISPAIFGAMFQGVMDKQQRRELGAHYTSEENILKLISPLFLDELWKEFDRAKVDMQLLDHFHDKISKLKFLDPACGCGNFLIITYRELRRLELEVLKMKVSSKQMILDITPLLKVNVEQFYGIEYEDFPCQIAQVGMWLMDHQMNTRAAEQFGMYYARLPLAQSATIVHGNALSIDWEGVISKRELSFILGNPPFVGYSLQSEEQKKDIMAVYVDEGGKSYKAAGKVDYVAAWFYKAAQFMAQTDICTAFVSTNSIVQGEQVAVVWEPLIKRFKIHIDFGYRTFIWGNEASGKAAVHCVIVGFSSCKRNDSKVIYESNGTKIMAQNINAYLVDAPNIFIVSRTKALCDVPNMVYGNKPADGGHLFIAVDEYETFIAKEPKAQKYIRKIYGATEYINNIDRYCLWLVNADPSEIKKMPLVMERIEKVRKFRLSSKKVATQESALTPSLFQEIRRLDSDYILVPRHSSEKRKYIPIGFVSKNIVVNDAVLIIPNATLYHFGILTSNVHMAWVRAVCGRIKSDYRYSKDIVYNNFPWPKVTDVQRLEITHLAQLVLDVRTMFPNSSLADLYDPLTMPQELVRAHSELDKAVWKAYSAYWKSEAEWVSELMQRYKLISGNK